MKRTSLSLSSLDNNNNNNNNNISYEIVEYPEACCSGSVF